MAEPVFSKIHHPIIKYFFAVRPAFLLTTVAGCALGFASALSGGAQFNIWLMALALMLALMLHAAVNVLNDYDDAVTGTDAANTGRLYPYTGGSRFIQNGLMTPLQMRNYGYALFASVISGGVVIVALTGLGLAFIGVLGLFIGWAYSASCIRLNARGWGELCVMVGFLGVVAGADFVQSHQLTSRPLMIGMPYALLTTAMLYINQFPDRQSDMQTGKRHWVVRLSLNQAVWGYWLLIVVAYACLAVAVYTQMLPDAALISLLPLPISLLAAIFLHRFAAEPHKLRPAIQLTLAAMLIHALLLTMILIWNLR